MAAIENRLRDTGGAGWDPAARAMYRAAQAVARPGGPGLYAELVRELADILGVATVFVAVFGDESKTTMRTLAAVLDGKPLRNFDYPLQGSPCAKVVGHAFRYVARGVSVEFPPGTIFGAKGMDAYAAFPLNDSAGTPLGLLAAMDRRPIADAHAGRSAAQDLRRADHRRDRTRSRRCRTRGRGRRAAACARSAAAFRGKLPRDLRGGGGCDLHP